MKDTCTIKCVDNNRTMQADVLSFVEKKFVTVALANTMKLTMPFNGRIYTCNNAGLTFTTEGPK